MTRKPIALTIAGSDPSGGAGIQADLKTFCARGVYGAAVLTALTAQNTTGVSDIHAPPPEFVAEQLRMVLEDLDVGAAKTGMLFSATIIEAIAPLLKLTRFPLVVDPVCVAQSGARLLREDAVEALRATMLPLAALITPNLPEAEVLSGIAVGKPEKTFHAMEKLIDMGAGAVLLKGGHAQAEAGGQVVDYLMTAKGEVDTIPHPRIGSGSLHGTGCSLAAAVAAELAKGLPLSEAVTEARAWLQRAIAGAYPVGKGVGPVDHLT